MLDSDAHKEDVDLEAEYVSRLYNERRLSFWCRDYILKE
jgi:hypothetical protein